MSGLGDLFGSVTDYFGTDTGGSSGSDAFGLDWGDMFSGSSYDWTSSLGDSGGDSGSSSWIKNLFGGSGSGSSSGSGIFGSLLSGLGGAASAMLSGKDLKAGIEAQGKESRRSLDFEAALKDYYTQEDKRRKRIALDTYGQFSTIKQYAPKYKNTPPVIVPTKPVAG
jgi:hypothetical protein